MSAAMITLLADIAPASSNPAPYFAAGIFGLIAFVLWLWALIDVLRQPHYAFEAAHVNRTLWIILLLGSLFCGLAWLVAIIYLVFPRAKVRNQAQLGPGPGFPRY